MQKIGSLADQPAPSRIRKQNGRSCGSIWLAPTCRRARVGCGGHHGPLLPGNAHATKPAYRSDWARVSDWCQAHAFVAIAGRAAHDRAYLVKRSLQRPLCNACEYCVYCSQWSRLRSDLRVWVRLFGGLYPR